MNNPSICASLNVESKIEFKTCFSTTEEKEDMEHLQAYNRKLLENILPVHVAEHFLSRDKNIDVKKNTQKLLVFCKIERIISNSRNYTMNNAKVLALCLHRYRIFPNFM